MIVRFFKKNKLRNANVEPDEIFLDSKNLPNFDLQQFEGRIEKTISKRTIFILGFFFSFCAFGFGLRLWHLQINKGEAYLARSESNTLDKAILFADRGIIYDRNKKELVWNKRTDFLLADITDEASSEKSETKQTTAKDFPTRQYLTPGFSHVLGYVS